MGQVVLTTIGAAIGANFGPVGAQIGAMAGAMLGSFLFGDDAPKGPRLADLKVQNSSYGAPIPIVYGKYRLGGNVIWATDLVEHPNDDSGKGGGGATVFSYTCSFAVAICAAPIANIHRVWADGKIIVDWRKNPDGTFIDDTPVKFNGAVGSPVAHFGNENDPPDSIMEQKPMGQTWFGEVTKPPLGVGNVPAYRGLVYMVFEDMDLGKFGNRIPNLSFEVEIGGEYPATKESFHGAATLRAVVHDISRRAGLNDNQMDVSQLTDIVKGYAITANQPARSALEPLMQAYYVDAVESDGKVKYVKRGGGAVATIPSNAIVQENKS